MTLPLNGSEAEGWTEARPCFDKDLTAVVVTLQMQRCLYERKVTSNLASMLRSGHQADNRKMVYSGTVPVPGHKVLTLYLDTKWYLVLGVPVSELSTILCRCSGNSARASSVNTTCII